MSRTTFLSSAVNATQSYIEGEKHSTDTAQSFQTPARMNHGEQLSTLPSDWRLVRVGSSKAPIAGEGWFDADDYSPDDAAALNGSAPPAWGLKSGPASGVVVLDLDADGWDASFQQVTGHPHIDLPPTIAWTSGKPGRSGRAFQVDPEWWPHLANRRAFTRPWRNGDPLGKGGKRSAITTFELRWDRCQSVIIGAHPETGGYHWLPGCSPTEIPDPAPAPDWLLQALVVQEHPDAPPVEPTAQDADRALAMLQCLPPEDYSAYSDWLRIGMALHHTDPGLLTAWVDWCRGMAAFDEAECLHKWESFGKSAHRGRPASIATLHHLAKQHGYREPKRKRERSSVAGGSQGDTTKTKPPSARAKRAERLRGGSANTAPPVAVGRDRPFSLLGFAGDDFFYQPDASGQITVIHRARHTSTQLNGLARLSWWIDTYPMYDGKGKVVGIDWAMAVDDLFAKQYEVGYFDPDKVRGLGAWWDEGRTVLHLGDRLIVSGAVHYLNKPFDSEYIYQRLRRLRGPKDAKPLTSDEAMQVLEVASSFMWEESSSAFLLSGWIVLAPICGALRWRPHAWLTAGPGSGKSTIIERFVNVLIGDMGVHPEGAATEASIRQDLMSSALPIVYDEADPNEKSDRMRIQNILSFARSCSSEGRGRIMKGSSDQSGAKKYQPKSMFLLSSVSTALKQGADKSRFAQLTLRRDDNQTAAQQAAHWKQLDQVLREVITDDFALRLIARTIGLIPVIRDAANIFAIAAAEHLGSQRLGDQYGALAAGAWSLCHERLPTPEEAAQWFAERPLTTYAEATEVPDEKSCLQTILEHQIRVDVESGTKAATVLELIRIAAGGRDEPQRKVAAALGGGPDSSQEAQHREITDEIAARSLGQIGVKVIEGDGQAPKRLAISYTAKGLRKVLADTSWELCWPTALARMEGATKGHQVWFKGIGNSRAVQLPMPELTDPPA